MRQNQYMYVVLIKALTGLGKFSRKICGYEYTHIAVSLDEKLVDFITFSRRKHYAPFDAGFMHEKREHYVFGNHREVKVKVFKIPLSRENEVKINEYIKKIEMDDNYIFNLYSMVTMPILHGFRIYKAYNCMSFVSKVIQLSNTVPMDKEYYQYNIKQLDQLLDPYFYKECYLEKFQEDKEYMSKVRVISNLQLFFQLSGRLIYRILLKRNDTYE